MIKSYSKILKIKPKGKSTVYDFTVKDTHRILANNFYTSNCSIKHPDSKSFMDAKMEKNKVTGANISLRIDDEFMQAVKNKSTYIQKFPIKSEKPLFQNEIDANEFFKKIIHNAWLSAEPGILFWDTIISESVADCYADLGFKTTSTNPCAEIPLTPYDSCRLLAMNLYSYVKNPFTKEAKFDFELFEKHCEIAQKIMDDIVDLELEKIDQILNKIETDPEPDDIKMVEKNLWSKIKDKCINGRRTGIGITAEGDMLAALGIKYGTKEGTEFSTKIHKIMAINVYKASCKSGLERGSFKIFDYNLEKNNPFIKRLSEADAELSELLKKGRRNIALLTTAPTGTVSIMTQTTSGIEPVFLPIYKRRRKINPNDKNTKVDFIDENGDSWEEYKVIHHKFKTWMDVNGISLDEVKNMNDQQISELIAKSPYYQATSADVNWVEKVKMQGSVQKWVDHSISVTVNLPKDVTEETVEQVYMTAWESGCKGITVYREGSRSGVLITEKKEDKSVEQIIKENNAPKRPKLVECDILRFQNNREKWIGFIGLLGGKPYEIFTGLLDSFQVPTFVEKGWIKKVKEPVGKDENGKDIFKSRYDLVYYDKDGYEQEMRGLSRAFNREYWNTGKLLSGILRHGMPLPNVINLIDSLNTVDGDNITSWKSGVKRMLKKYIKDDTLVESGYSCPNCGNTKLKYESACISCECGWSKCS